MSLRDELAAWLGPGNDDATAYAQADTVLDVLTEYIRERDELTMAGTIGAWRRYGIPREGPHQREEHA